MALVAVSQATGETTLGPCVAGDSVPGSPETRSKDAMDSVGIFSCPTVSHWLPPSANKT